MALEFPDEKERNMFFWCAAPQREPACCQQKPQMLRKTSCSSYAVGCKSRKRTEMMRWCSK